MILKRRIEKLEKAVKGEGLTEKDVEFILSCLPVDYANAVYKKLCEIEIEARNKNNIGEIIREKCWSAILKVLPHDDADEIRAKIAARR